MVEEYKKKFIFVLTQGIVRSKATFQASSVLSNRTSYATAMGSGVSASLIDKLAEEEIKRSWDFVKERLFETNQSKKDKLEV